MKRDMSGARGFVRGRQKGGEQGSVSPLPRGEPRAPPHPAPVAGTARPRCPEKSKSRLVMAHGDRETSGICLKAVKENHYFLEEKPLALRAWRRHPSAVNQCLIQSSCTKPTPTLPDMVRPAMQLCKGDRPLVLLCRC